VKLTATNPVGVFRYADSIQRVVVSLAGAFGVLDGGIEYFNPADHTVSGLVITEETLGGDIVDAVVVSEHKGYAVIGVYQGNAATTRLVSFDPSKGELIAQIIASEGWDIGHIELTPNGSELWVADRTRDNPGIRIFDTADDLEITDEPIDVGLPPMMICFAQ